MSIFVPPGPKAVEKDEILRPIKFVVEIKEDVKDRVEIYPALPNPATVDSKVGEERNPAVCSAVVVETREAVETYPAVPKPATVDVIAFILVPPGPKAVEKEEIATPIEFVVEIRDDVKDKEEI